MSGIRREEVLAHNRHAWARRVVRGEAYVDTATEEDFANPWRAMDPHGWLGRELNGKRVLCLAAGGGRHGVLLAAVGARVTVVDLSPAMLALDSAVARKRGLEVRIVEAAMDDLSVLAPASFEVVIQPVSTCYVPEILPVFLAVARVLSPGGLYLSTHKQPGSLQAESHVADNQPNAYIVKRPYYEVGPLPSAREEIFHREEGTIEFLHTWEDLIGGLGRSGFVVEDLVEPRHADLKDPPGSFRHRSAFLPPFVSIKARRRLGVLQGNFLGQIQIEGTA